MTPERWHEIKAAFEAVDSAPPDKRASVLDRVCEGNKSLRRDLENLMRANSESSDELLEDLVGAEAAKLAATPTRELTGQSLGPYRVSSLIGSGGMGEVYAAEDSRLGRQVALKVLPTSCAAHSDRVQRFQQEARAASALNHPNIVTIHDFGQAEGLYYMATEYVRGKTLRALISEGPLPERQLAQIAVQTAGALASAHEAGIVHRDIKPENIMIRPDGYVKVLDFGLAKLRERSSIGHDSLTRTGTILGTTAYMSPEQVRGLRTDAASDIFSLGVVLYEMAAGQTPFKGKTGADQIAAVLEHEAKPIRTLVPAIHPALEAIIGRCLQKECNERYPSAQALHDELLAFRQDIDSRMSRPALPNTTSTRGHERWGFAAAAVVLIVVATLLFFRRPDWYHNSRISSVPRGEGASQSVISATSRYLAYSTETPAGLQSLSVRLLSSSAAVVVVPPEDARHYAFAISPDENFLYYTVNNVGARGVLYRVPLLGGPRQKVLDDVAGLSFSRGGSKFAFVRSTPGLGTLWIADADGSNPRQIAQSREDRPFYAFAWEPAGKAIFYSEGARTASGLDWKLWVADLIGGAPRVVTPLRKAITALYPLPDGSGFLVNSWDPETNRPQIWRLSKVGAWMPITHDLNEYQGLSVTADSERIAVTQAERQSELWIIDVNNPAGARQISDTQPGFGTPAWSLHGGIVAIATGSGGNTNLWNMAPDGSNKRLLTVPGSTSDAQPAACPDRDEIVFVSDRKGGSDIWRIRPDGSEVKQLTFGVADSAPQCLAGGIVMYRSQVGKQVRTRWVPLDGGAPSEASAGDVWNQQISADGKLKLIEYGDEKTQKTHLAIKSRDGGRTLLDFEGTVGMLDPAARGVAFLSRRDGSMEIWYQPISQPRDHAGSVGPRKLTRLGDRIIFGMDWSPDGRFIVCSLGRITNSLVLIDDLR